MKILKNTTLLEIELEVLGISILASGQVTIDERYYDLLGSQDSLLEINPLITLGSIIVNDGTIDFDIPRAKKYIEVSEISIIENNDSFIAGNPSRLNTGFGIIAEVQDTRRVRLRINDDNIGDGCFLPRFTISRKKGTIGLNRKAGFTLSRRCA